ncbi:hypothetical protein F5Y07DRAFT_412518 [Xylaria sp. FL0933]|nr:hypothetical protein F5Y07DRAFT_412518 [Xylaria sp. FL0933]
MAGNGDLDLARELQAEFSRAKQPRRRGPARASDRSVFQTPFESQFKNPSQVRRQDGLSVLEQEADAFFHQHQRPLPSPTPQTVTETRAPSAPVAQQPKNLQPRLGGILENSNSDDKSSTSASAVPWHQKTDQSSTEAYLDAIPSTSATPMHLDRPPVTEETEGAEDIEMESVDCSSTSASKSTTNNTQKGLAASIWNPANANERADSVSSNWSFETSSDTTKPTPIVTSGITKGPGLMASRWNQGF